MEEVKFPDVEVRLSGTDGNAMAIMVKVIKAIRRGGATPAQLSEFKREAMRGSYEQLLQTCEAWVVVT